MKCLFVTGAAGFIGARLVESARARGRALVSVDRLPHFRDRPEHETLDFGECVSIEDSLEFLDSQAGNIDQIFHLGAISQTTARDASKVREHNSEYSKRLWEIAVKHRLPFVYASSASTYGDGCQGFDDCESKLKRLEPQSPYARSKHDFDLWAISESKTGKCPPFWSGFKFFNVYGYGERHKHGMWSIVLNAYEQIRAHGKVQLFESEHPDFPDGGQMRDFVYVDDVIRVLWFAADKPIPRGIYNLGTGHARSFQEMTQAVFEAMKCPENIEYIPMPEALKSQYQYFTQAKIERLREQGYEERFWDYRDAVADYLHRLGVQD